MTPMAAEILAMVRKKRHVSFAELQRIEGFGGGHVELRFDSKNIVLWQGLTEAAAAAIGELRQAQLIHPVPTVLLTYLVDGRIPRLPIAKHFRHYKNPHWLPVVFDVGPEFKLTRRTRPPGARQKKFA